MTVRAWVTISIIVLGLLSVAVAVRILQPLRPPALLASVGATRLEAVASASCWTQRDGGLRCARSPARPPRERPEVPPAGVVRVVAAYPVQPKRWSLELFRVDGPALLQAFDDRLGYNLEPGLYFIRAEASYTDRDYVRYSFAFRVP